VEGRFEEAECLAREGVAAALQGGVRTEFAYALLVLGDTLKNVASFPDAHAVSQQSLDLYCELGQHTYVTEAHSLLADIDQHRGRYEEARDHARTSLELARAQGPPYCIGLNYLLLGCLNLAEGAPARAHQGLQDSLTAYQEFRGNRDDLSLVLADLALAAHGLRDMHGARQYLRRALEIAGESEAVLPLWWTLLPMALLLADKGENERAVELYALASRFPLVAKSRWFADVAGKTLAEVAATLPAERVAVLEERGRARDLKTTAAELLAELAR
jgi:tetratricopeptide (TPR) repeat protein